MRDWNCGRARVDWEIFVMIELESFESADLLNAAVDEGVSEDSESAVESVGEGSARGSDGCVGSRERLDEQPSGRAEGAVGGNGERGEAHAGVSGDEVLVLLALAFFSDVDSIIATSASSSDDGAVDGEATGVSRVGGDPNVGGPGLGEVEDGAGVGVGGEASGAGDSGDGGGESVVSSLSPAGGLCADKRMFAGGVDEGSGTEERRRDNPERKRSGAAARAITGRTNAGVGTDER